MTVLENTTAALEAPVTMTPYEGPAPRDAQGYYLLDDEPGADGVRHINEVPVERVQIIRDGFGGPQWTVWQQWGQEKYDAATDHLVYDGSTETKHHYHDATTGERYWVWADDSLRVAQHQRTIDARQEWAKRRKAADARTAGTITHRRLIVVATALVLLMVGIALGSIANGMRGNDGDTLVGLGILLVALAIAIGVVGTLLVPLSVGYESIEPIMPAGERERVWQTPVERTRAAREAAEHQARLEQEAAHEQRQRQMAAAAGAAYLLLRHENNRAAERTAQETVKAQRIAEQRKDLGLW